MQQENEDQLRRRLAELVDFVENATEGLHRVGPDGTILWANQAELDLLGYSADEYIGRNISEFHADADTIKDILGRLLKGDKLSDHPARLVCKNGEIRDVMIQSSALFEENRFVHTRCFTRDVTDHKRAETALRVSENRFRALMEQAPFSVQVLSPSGRTTSVNAAWTQLWGVTLDQIADYNILKDPQLESKGIAPYLRRAFAGEVVRIPGVEYDPEATLPGRSVNKEPARWVSATAYPLKDEAGNVTEVVLVHNDITEKIRADAALREAARRKDEFLATLAHELRNPLAPICTSLQLLKLPGVDEATARANREVIDRQVHHLVRLVDDLMDVSRVMHGNITLRKESIDLSEIAKQAVETAKPLIDMHSHNLSVKFPDAPLIVCGDTVRLVQIVSNLLINAAKYTQSPGHIALTVSREGASGVLRVRDDGIGIAPQAMAGMFELFVQGDRTAAQSTGGLGVGLTLSRNLVVLHGGTIEGRSDGLNKGSEFIVTLPLHLAGERNAAARIADDDPPVAPGRRILVVDDNVDAADSFSALLRFQGHAVSVAYTGQAALDLALAERPDLVFLDIGMPGMDGFEVARQLRRLPGLENIVIAALSGWGQDEDRRKSADAGFDHHLVKPPEIRDVQGVLSQLGK